MTISSKEITNGKQLADEYIAESDSQTITYDETTDSYRVSVTSNDSIPISITIIQAIAAISERNPLDLDPLTGYIDPDCLEGLFDGTPVTPVSHPTVSFSYLEYQVTVKSPSEVRISL